MLEGTEIIGALAIAGGIVLALLVVITAGRQLLDLSDPDGALPRKRGFGRRLVYRVAVAVGGLAAAGYILH